MKSIDIRDFADDTRDIGSTRYYEYYTAEAAQRVIAETDMLERIGKGEVVMLTTGDEHWDWMTECNIGFARPIMKRINADFGAGALDLLKMAGRNVSNDIVAFRRKLKANAPPEWSKPQGMLIPDINTQLMLSKPWEFNLYVERRNKAMFVGLFGTDPKDYWWGRIYIKGEEYKRGDCIPCKIGKDALLKVNRVYIRQGGDEYSSLTFYVHKGAKITSMGETITLKKAVRFWAKLGDVNDIRCRFNMVTVRSDG